MTWRDALSTDERKAVLAMMTQVAWSDGRVSLRELTALRAACAELRQDLPTLGALILSEARTPMPQSSVTPTARLIGYASSVWIGLVDGILDRGQGEALMRLRSELSLQTETADQVESWVWRRVTDLETVSVSKGFADLLDSLFTALPRLLPETSAA